MQYRLVKRKGENVLAVSIQTDDTKTTVFSAGLSNELFYSFRERLERGLELNDSLLVQVLCKRLVATHRRKLKTASVKQPLILVHSEQVRDTKTARYWLNKHSKRKQFISATLRNDKQKQDRDNANKSVIRSLGLKR